jgi:hypothetical protein
MPAHEERRVPVFQTEAEEIAFWETHDPEDYLTGEEEALERILSPEPGELERGLIVSLTLAPFTAAEYFPPLTLHFAAAALSEEADRDLSVVFEREVISDPLHPYGAEYRRASRQWGTPGAPIRQLGITLAATSRREAEKIEGLLRTSTASGREAPATGLSERTQRVVPRLAKWLLQRNAREITEEQADQFLHP